MRCTPWLVLAPLLGGAAGCVPLFYAYPAVSYVPAVNVGKTHEKTYAFRVDIADRKRAGDPDETGRYVLRQIHVAKSGHVNGQAKLALDSGFYWNCLVTCFAEQTNHTVRLRFYRSGYRLIEVHSWQTEGGLVWKEAADAAAREKAVDALLGPSEPAIKRAAGKGFAWLAPGSESLAHQNALRFAAAEYEQVAALGQHEGHEEIYDRCLAKAQWLRDRAEQ